MARLKIIGPQGAPCWAPTEKKLNNHRKIMLKDFYSINKDKGKEVEYDTYFRIQSRLTRESFLI
jgi:hypothetical protein